MSICWDFFQGSPVDKSWQFRELLQIPHQIWFRILRFVKLLFVSLSCQKHLVLAAFFLTFHMGLVTKKRAIDLVRSWECEKGWQLGPTCQQVGDLWGESSKPIQGVSSFTPPLRLIPAGPRNLKGLQIFPPEKKHHQSNVLLRRCGVHVFVRAMGFLEPTLRVEGWRTWRLVKFDFFQREILRCWFISWNQPDYSRA